MQRLLRHILLVLLSLSLPATGWASVVVPGDCAMHKAHADMKSNDSCCQHKQVDHAKPASPCKGGPECSGGGMLWPAAAQQASQFYPPHTTVSQSQSRPQLASSAPAAVWRPPQL